MSTTPSSSPYAVLGLLDSADLATAKAAYKARVLSVHPDTGGDPAAFREAQEAWEQIQAGWTPPAASPPPPTRTTDAAPPFSRAARTAGTPHRTTAPAADEPVAEDPPAEPSRRLVVWGLAGRERRLTIATAWAVLLHALQGVGAISMPGRPPVVPGSLYDLVLVVAPWSWVATLLAVVAWVARCRARATDRPAEGTPARAARWAAVVALVVALAGWTVVLAGWGLVLAVGVAIIYGAFRVYSAAH